MSKEFNFGNKYRVRSLVKLQTMSMAYLETQEDENKSNLRQFRFEIKILEVLHEAKEREKFKMNLFVFFHF